MSRNYKFKNPEGVYFVSFAVVEWIMLKEKDYWILILFEACSHAMQSRGSEGWTRSTGSSRDVLLRLPGLGRPEYCG